jgi:hypothetical protein
MHREPMMCHPEKQSWATSSSAWAIVLFDIIASDRAPAPQHQYHLEYGS